MHRMKVVFKTVFIIGNFEYWSILTSKQEIEEIDKGPKKSMLSVSHDLFGVSVMFKGECCCFRCDCFSCFGR